jgi:hypothetical protein
MPITVTGMKKLPIIISAATAALSALAVPLTLHAQTGPALLLKPWDASGAVENTTTGLIENEGHVQENGDGFQFSSVESEGRFRLFPGMEASPRLGYDVTFINAHTSAANFPHQLLDASVGAGSFVGIYHNWVLGATLGVGYAGSGPFEEGRAWYGRASFIIARKFSDQDAVGIGLDYDGHRSYLPDSPVPGLAYSHTFDPHLDVVLGAPLSSLTWKPDDHWRIYGDWLLLTDFDINATYMITKQIGAYADLETHRDQFWIPELPDHKRLLYLQRRVEGGVKWDPFAGLHFTAAIGYAFSTDFRFGWDYRNTGPYLYASNEPYIRFGLEYRF